MSVKGPVSTSVIQSPTVTPPNSAMPCEVPAPMESGRHIFNILNASSVLNVTEDVRVVAGPPDSDSPGTVVRSRPQGLTSVRAFVIARRRPHRHGVSRVRPEDAREVVQGYSDSPAVRRGRDQQRD